MFQNVGYGVTCPFGWVRTESNPKMLQPVIVHHPAKLSSSSYNGWSTEIADMKCRVWFDPYKRFHEADELSY